MRTALSAVIATALTVLWVAPSAPAQADGPAGDRATLMRYAEHTWASFEAMVDTGSGLPTDQLFDDGHTDVQTSTTNIGAYMWSAVAAEKLGIIGHAEVVGRLTKTITTLEGMETYTSTGQFYNWYDHRDGAKLTSWPPTGDPLDPILSSVDNAWLATGIRIVEKAVPELSSRAGAIYDSMDFGFYYVPDKNRILFLFKPSTGDGPCCYDTVLSESRIADYIGIAKGELPRKEYYGRWPSFPDTCDFSFQEQKPSGYWASYDGVDVYDGSYTYGDTKITPSWGGSMFEALMPSLFVPEEKWGAGSWRQNHPLTVDAQIDLGLNVAGYGVWGFSPSNTPEGGYGAYGVDLAGMDPNGMSSNEDNTLVDHGFAGCGGRPATEDPPASAYTNGVVTPHAAFLGLRYRPAQAVVNPRAAGGRARRLRQVGLRRLGQRRHRSAVRLVPLAGPGHDHGRARQLPRKRRHAHGVRLGRHHEGGPADPRGRGVQHPTAGLHPHWHHGRRHPGGDEGRRRHLRPRW